MNDNYPTRKLAVETIIRRGESCIHASNHLTEQEFRDYSDNGYIIIKEFFKKADTEAMQSLANSNYTDPKFYNSPEPETGAVRSILNFHSDEVIDQIANSETMMGIRDDILGGPSYIHQSRVNYKRGMESNGWKWHSDFETWHYQDGMPAMSCFSAMIPLDDNTHVNGPLMVLSGSHKEFVCTPKPQVESSAEENFSDQKEGIPSGDAIEHFLKKGSIEVVTCNVGDLVLFDCNILHVSNPNVTPHGRMNMFFVYNSCANKLNMPYSGGEARPTEMATR